MVGGAATGFDGPSAALGDYLDRRSSSGSNAVVWVGVGVGAEGALAFALDHPERQPTLMVLVSGTDAEPGGKPETRQPLRCPVLLVHGTEDITRGMHDRIAQLQPNEARVQQRTFSGSFTGLETKRPVLFRGIPEYCAPFTGSDPAASHQRCARRPGIMGCPSRA